jgi:hypothetical protein
MWDDDNYVSPVSHISTNVKVETLFTIDCSHKNNITLSNKILKELSKEELFTPCLICSDNITILDIVTKNVVGHSERDSKKEIVDKKTKLIHLLHVDCYEDFKKNGDYCNNTGCNCPNEGRINRFIYKRIPEIKNISLPFMEIFLHDSCFINKNSYTETIEKYLEK